MNNNICIICNKSFPITYKQRNKKTCSPTCFKKLLSLQKNNPQKIKIANQKRKITNIKKYGKNTPLSIEQQSKFAKKTYNKINNILNNISFLYSKHILIKKLNSQKFNYKKYLGKSKNRTMINDDPTLYKSLLYYTKFIEEYNLYGKKHIPLSLRLLIAAKYKFKLTDNLYCKCKSRLSFNHAKMDFSKLYCEKCILPRNSKEHFKLKYGEDWELFYNLNCKKYIENGHLQGLKNVATLYQNYGKVLCPNIGKNEKILLDLQEKKDNCIIDRNTIINGLYPDGYCKETNTIYEVYEPFHKWNKLKDKTRIEYLKKQLNCNVKIIYDGWKPNEK